ncbi:alpha/beta fold hydrolase [Actinomycetospora sp. CA-053990]|uniref:alpha/beta fold hydrolase n=1 Tax=Actinomycetospora sp. CA-053990 TaxID=3239891 RepID=UPI003D92A376
MEIVTAGVLATAYVEDGPADGWPVVLSHRFPYDVHAYDEVVPLLTARGARVVRPYLRGHGPTRFLAASTPRSGQQAALGSDLLALLDALGLDTAILAGYDWGGLSLCVVAALWPHRVTGLVSLASYDIIDVARSPVRWSSSRGPPSPEVTTGVRSVRSGRPSWVRRHPCRGATTCRTTPRRTA